MTNTDAFAERMARADQAFTRHTVDKVSLRDLGPELGVSYDTVRADVAAFRKYLSEDQTAALAEKRVTFLAELDAICARSLYVYERYKDSKPLTAVAALNTYVATLAHRRAVEGLDAPREDRVKAEVKYVVTWDEASDLPDASRSEGDETPDPTYPEIASVASRRD